MTLGIQRRPGAAAAGQTAWWWEAGRSPERLDDGIERQVEVVGFVTNALAVAPFDLTK